MPIDTLEKMCAKEALVLELIGVGGLIILDVFHDIVQVLIEHEVLSKDAASAACITFYVVFQILCLERNSDIHVRYLHSSRFWAKTR